MAKIKKPAADGSTIVLDTSDESATTAVKTKRPRRTILGLGKEYETLEAAKASPVTYEDNGEEVSLARIYKVSENGNQPTFVWERSLDSAISTIAKIHGYQGEIAEPGRRGPGPVTVDKAILVFVKSLKTAGKTKQLQQVISLLEPDQQAAVNKELNE